MESITRLSPDKIRDIYDALPDTLRRVTDVGESIYAFWRPFYHWPLSTYTDIVAVKMDNAGYAMTALRLQDVRVEVQDSGSSAIYYEDGTKVFTPGSREFLLYFKDWDGRLYTTQVAIAEFVSYGNSPADSCIAVLPYDGQDFESQLELFS